VPLKPLLLVMMAVALLTAGCNTHTERPPNATDLIAEGEIVYIEYCAECHQTDGTGWSTLYPRLAGNPLVTLHDPEPLIVTVVYGLGSMPGFRTRLTTKQMAAVISYVRNAWGNEAPAVSPKQIQ
jgi:alcohol dehydrogenase (quinone), cytochrome c subunit